MKQKISGVYCILNIVNKKIYIGSAVDVYSRWRTHQWALKKGVHHSQYLQRSYEKYGEKLFKYLIVDTLLPIKEELLAVEQNWIDRLHPEYNTSPTANSCLGVIGSPESNLKKSIHHKFRGAYGVNHPSSKRIFQYSLEGEYLQTWFGADEIERTLGFSAPNIRKACTSNKEWCPYGFIWSYDELNPVSRKRRDRSSTYKKIGQFALDGTLIYEYNSLQEAHKKYGKLNSKGQYISGICHALDKEGRSAYGFRWKHL